MTCGSPSLPASNLREVIQLARKNPGKLTYASPGAGSSMHLAGELLKQEAGIDMLHVPFKGGAQAYPELMAGRIDLQLDPTFGIYRYVQQGRIKAIAVTSAKRPARVASSASAIAVAPASSSATGRPQAASTRPFSFTT